MKNTYLLHPTCHLVETASKLALFRLYESKVYLEDELVENSFEFSEMIRRLQSATSIDLKYQNTVKKMLDLGLVVKISEDDEKIVIDQARLTEWAQRFANLHGNPKNAEKFLHFAQKLCRTRISIFAMSELSSHFDQHLAEVPFFSVEKIKPKQELTDSLCLVISDGHQLSQMLELNSYLLCNGTRALFIILDSVGGWLGPSIGIPGAPCLQCVVKRAWRQNPMALEYIKKSNRVDTGWLRRGLFDAAITELIKISTAIDSPWTGRGVYEFDGLHYAARFHHVLPDFNCEACVNKR